MIKVETMESPSATVITIAAPITTLDYEIAGEVLRALPTDRLSRVLMDVDSVALAEPKVIWEDLKLAPLGRHMKRIAMVTDVDCFARLSEVLGAVWPGMQITRFDTADRAAAIAWLATSAPE